MEDAEEIGFVHLDIAKRLLDFGYHPPTIYFPLNVEECMMIEPTETESKETLDGFIDTMIQIAKEAEEESRDRSRSSTYILLLNVWMKQQQLENQFYAI